ncbi:MAG: metal transporter [Halioglobus sp.]|nr:metal transporter [Halioglobus sp.]|tara:strand:- start:80 stop:1045 length:966 start_codon:yes stop_codon:yes gene_type:complete
MIRTLLLTAEDECLQGGAELIQRWRQLGGKLWLDLEGEPGDEFRQLLTDMGCDELAIRDSFRTRHPPKAEHFDAHSFVLFRGIASLDETLELDAQQLGIWVGDGHLITAHRGPSVSIEHFWQLQAADGLLAEPNILALKLLEYASGRYLERLLDFEDRLGELEDSIVMEQSEQEMRELVLYRARLRKLRRIFSYHQRLAEDIWRCGSIYLGSGEDDSLHIRRNVYDRCERLYSLCAMYYEICGDLIEGYISLSSHRLNNTMKVLTIITAVFVPLGFLAGLYGMNFEYMPELSWRYAYFTLLGVMALVATSMLVMFRRIRWL